MRNASSWLKVLVAIAAISVAGAAAFFSVTGLGLLFSGATLSVMIMAGTLEFAKIVAATYLKQSWTTIRGLTKWYLTLAVVILMLITSAGIFGYLSNAFQAQNIRLDQIDREIAVYEMRITQNNSEIERNTEYLQTLQDIRISQEQSIATIVDRSLSTARLTQMVASSDAQMVEVSNRIVELVESNSRNYEIINTIKLDNIDVEREIGGFRFIAESFDIPLNTVVKFFILLIVFVFDPLAIALVIAFNALLMSSGNKRVYEVYGEHEKNNDNIIENVNANDGLLELDDAKLKWEEWMHPSFDWSNTSSWINTPSAVQYWIKNKGGSEREHSRLLKS
jgi:phage shock protein PspC (stress-responsive transcriptional regulator)